MSHVAVAQLPPVWLDRAATLQACAEAVATAATSGAKLVVFPETHIPGYPAWIWRLRPGGDARLAEALHARLLDQAVDLEADGLASLREAARKHEVTIVVGVHEREGTGSRSTLYNTAVVIGEDGGVLLRHRKLMPTHPERMVWGFGDGSGLKVVDTAVGRLGVLICWENYMPLARYALYAQGVEIYVAPTYDSGPGWIGTLQHIAREGRCWVIGAGVALQHSDLPDEPSALGSLYPQDESWINPGDSVVIAPGGSLQAGPMHEETGLLQADIDAAQVAVARRTLDVAGHYARPDVFTLQVDTREQRPVHFD